jgi:hypothetical protein
VILCARGKRTQDQSDFEIAGGAPSTRAREDYRYLPPRRRGERTSKFGGIIDITR